MTGKGVTLYSSQKQNICSQLGQNTSLHRFFSVPDLSGAYQRNTNMPSNLQIKQGRKDYRDKTETKIKQPSCPSPLLK